MSTQKRIGILTSGGDCAGLNAVIRAAVHRAELTYGWSVIGLREGTQGLLRRPVDYQVMSLGMVDGAMLRLGGTVLGTTNRGEPFAYPMGDGTVRDRSDEVIGGFRELGLDALIGIGGDGSFAILRRLAQKAEIPFVGVPKTIDNDLGLTEVSVGFDTAVGVAVEALDRLQPTAASHQRVMVLEVMGRDAGHIALAAGIAGGADVILIPEIAYSIEAVAAKIRQVRSTGRNFALVVVSEAVKTLDGSGVTRAYHGGETRYGGIGSYIGDRISEATGAETRVTVLGHVQRGSPPSPRDRLIASAFGVHAVDLIAEGQFDRMVAWSNRGVHSVPLAEAIARNARVLPDDPLITTARGLGISLGD
ncbi:ATP-dependent 6-phosphofructokinase [Azospirillum thermophilum]|uniref:ATP-dependent 6-phosphofructokinase n=1 Tax=Azospirillum thermophilum TaxID=2202148 RepID=A0A2S2CVM1_9PROT|nr:ATP-dependent 6-phosphofructokinase [Azospirillum thermophilum]AWK88455.1 6-phosphofructokinase [Azospirillum thermophilum]